MPDYTLTAIDRQPLTQNILSTIGLIREFKGKQDLFKAQAPEVLENMRQIAMIQSTESSNRIEGVTAPPKRVQELVQHKTTPVNRSEQEISGYRDALQMVHNHFAHMPFTPNLILQLHHDLYQFTGIPAGNWKTVDNQITETLPDGTVHIRFQPVPAYLTSEAMQQLHTHFNHAWELGEIERLLLTATYGFDFLCVHPFLDGNGRLSRLITLLLLYRAGYEVGRFVSLEKLIEDSKESYYEALARSSEGWHENKHTLLPWWEYFLGIILRSYKEFEQRAGTWTKAPGAKTLMILDAIQRLPETFSIRELQDACPIAGIDLIRRVLRQEREAGHLLSEGRGPKAHWKKLP